MDRLIDSRRGIDRTTVGPHALIPTLASQVVGLADQRLASRALLSGAVGQDLRHGAGLGQFFCERLSVAPDSGVGWYFGAMIGASKRQSRS
jgi:hypothetical protein